MTHDSQRFVVLYHELPETLDRPNHYDFMLESGHVLLAWAMENPLETGLTLMAQRLNDHRKEYLDYQGPVSGDRGQVSRIMSGHYRPVENANPTTTTVILTFEQPVDRKERWLLTITEADPGHDCQIQIENY